ncbi:HDOD domain-containing protein [Opitutales bacterium ASA1]|jgi:HD-like signal output (HDOD) protein|uniref:HDOD domain-containing protein n=1 Tax=Congregicoccus parvus TaxID=3081749 RepID=UPI002B2AAC59|nr:HDOD domain-containing protein [Opitutales bacterium ASA1]
MSSPLTDQELSAAVAELPPVSSVLHRLLDVLNDPDSDLDDVTRLVQVETALAAQVLRLANSAVFAAPEPASTIGEAVQRLGAAEVHMLVSTLVSRQFVARPLRYYALEADKLWEHALAVAVCAETVARETRGDRAMLYLAGILHPVGMIALDRVAHARGLSPRSGDAPISTWEEATFDTDNAGVASYVLQSWNLPEAVALCVAGRYDPQLGQEHEKEARMLHVASCMAGSMGAALESERGVFRAKAEMIESAGVAWDEYSELVMEASQRLLRTRTLLSLA